ncbi:MAG: hypothetical protein LBE35_07695 [Clostridiales bacterium]|jgi:hypothetical protein|nr:hypothetical protein [Clostridiales bacterium]
MKKQIGTILAALTVVAGCFAQVEVVMAEVSPTLVVCESVAPLHGRPGGGGRPPEN